MMISWMILAVRAVDCGRLFRQRMLTAVLLLCFVASSCDGFKFFQDKIPNGYLVPHPCKPNILWEGVGHIKIGGGGERNPFGQDFDDNGKVWSETLCRLDSDGDGQTNGEELGDPNCVWTEGAVPQLSTGLSHPGFCDPIDSPECAEQVQKWDICAEDPELQCDAFDDENVRAIMIQFPETQVPNRETTYWCMTFDLDLEPDREYHLIGYRPAIVNKNVMHHIVVTGCEETGDTSWKLDSPTECGMSMVACRRMLLVWTVGVNGECFPDTYGFRMGKGGFKTLTMQFHWNNPEERADYSDSSGIILYLSTDIRENDAGIMGVGTTHLEIPPRMESVEQRGHCGQACTNRFPERILISSIMFHMHYLGRSGVLEHRRGGTVLQTITADPYSYDSPEIFTFFDEPIEFLRGDEMELTCHYRSTHIDDVTYYGDATSDEMCSAFFTFYPKARDIGSLSCYSHGSLGVCSTGNNFFVSEGDRTCDVGEFVDNAWSIHVQAIEGACNSTLYPCPTGCKDAVEDVRRASPCLHGEAAPYVELQVMMKFMGEYTVELVALMHSCDDESDETRKDLCEYVLEKSQGPPATIRRLSPRWKYVCGVGEWPPLDVPAGAARVALSGGPLVMLVSISLTKLSTIQ